MQHTSLEVCAHAIRTCWQSFDNSDNGGKKDKDLIVLRVDDTTGTKIEFQRGAIATVIKKKNK